MISDLMNNGIRHKKWKSCRGRQLFSHKINCMQNLLLIDLMNYIRNIKVIFASLVVCDEPYAGQNLKDFKKADDYPFITVTVDMLETGIERRWNSGRGKESAFCSLVVAGKKLAVKTYEKLKETKTKAERSCYRPFWTGKQETAEHLPRQDRQEQRKGAQEPDGASRSNRKRRKRSRKPETGQ